MSSESETDSDDIPAEILETANEICLNLLPEKSRRQYTAAYNEFKSWRSEKKITSFDEKVILVYFNEIAEKFAPSTLWARYSMLKATLYAYDSVEIGSYKNVISFLKRKNKHYKRKKSKILTSIEVTRFCREAEDEKFLLHKAVLVTGVSGACRREELTNLTIENVKDYDRKMMHISILKTKTGVERSFAVVGDFYKILKQYMNLRPKKCSTNRLFLTYRDGKCTNQPVGINKIGSIPNAIAKFLNLSDSDLYTGHSFRRTSATLLVEAGGDITNVKKLGGWKSTAVAESYIENSLLHKQNIAQRICDSVSIPMAATSNSKLSSTSASTSALNQPSTSALNQPSTSTTNLKRKSTFQKIPEELEEMPIQRGPKKVKFNDDVESRDVELFSQQVVISSTPNGGLDLESFSQTQNEDNVESIPQAPSPVGLASSQKRIMENFSNNDRYNFIFNNCTVKIVFNETSPDNH
ncbi:hypothetical protein TKK_0019400 [Trichogramma kaykai]